MFHTAAADSQGVLQHMPMDMGGPPKPHILCDSLSTVTRSRVLELRSGVVPAEESSRTPRQVCRTRWLPICSAPCRHGQVQGCLQRCTSVHLFLMCGCRRTAGVRRSEKVANSSNPAPGAAFGRVTLGAFAGSTAFGWLGSFL